MAPIVTSSRKSRPSGRGGKGADAFLTPVLVAVIVLAALAILRPVILPSGKTAPAPEAGDETTARPSSRTVASPRSGGGNGEDPSDTAAPGGEGNGATRRQPRAATRNAAGSSLFPAPMLLMMGVPHAAACITRDIFPATVSIASTT